MTTQETIELFGRYVIGNYRRFPVCLVRGEGSEVWDAEGQRYLDFFPGWGCDLIGHCPPRVVKAVQDQVARLIHVPNTWYTESQGLLAKALSERTTFDGRAFFCNSGTEANEAAIKLARLNGRGTGPGRPDRYQIVTMLNSSHARTMGALTAPGQPQRHHRDDRGRRSPGASGPRRRDVPPPVRAPEGQGPAHPGGAGQGGHDRRATRHRRGSGRDRVPETPAPGQRDPRHRDPPAPGPE